MKAGKRIISLCMAAAMAVLAVSALAVCSPRPTGAPESVLPGLPAGAYSHAARAFADEDGGAQLDKDSLADGSYTLRAEMIKINRKDYSMSNDAIGHDVRLAVSGGQYYLSVDFKGLSISLGGSSFFGYLARLKYYGAGFSYDKYGEPQGAKIPAEVLSYQLDSSGKPIVDRYNDKNSPYPKTLRFPLVNRAGFEGDFVPLEVYVPIMESISPGSGTQSVLMRLDWATLKVGGGSDEPAVADTKTKAKPVNKAKLKAQLKKAKAIKKGQYTDSSWAALKSAIKTAQSVYKSKYATQSEVNEQAALLKRAVKRLKKRPKETVGKGGMADGKYEVQVDLWHATQDKPSMGNGALNHTALIEVTGDSRSMTVSGHRMQVGNIMASLLTLQVKQPNGSYKHAKVVERKLPGGKPSAFRFALHGTPTYIAVKVDPQVEVMGDDPVDARLRISWDTLKKVSNEATVSGFTGVTTGNVDGNGGTSKAAELKDEATGIRATAGENIIPDGTEIKAAKLGDAAALSEAGAALGGGYAISSLYDIELVGADGKPVVPAAPVRVFLPAPAQTGTQAQSGQADRQGETEQTDQATQAAGMRIYRLDAGGKKTLVSHTAEAGALVFSAKQFGRFAVVSDRSGSPTQGVYTLTATPYYAHPATGEIEDSGKNPGIGQGMTESVLGKQAQLELTDDGRSFITMRFSLMDNIKDCELQIQNGANADFEPLEYTVTQESMESGTADLCFETPLADAQSVASLVVRASFYVIPMGRDVIFYMTFADPVPGESDFVTGAYPKAKAIAEEPAAAKETGSAGGSAATAANENAVSKAEAEAADWKLRAVIAYAITAIIIAAIGGYMTGRRRGRRMAERQSY